MDQEAIDKYREVIGEQLKEKEAEIGTSISYITIAALGFFLTINQEFIVLSSSGFKVLMVLSIGLLMVSFFLQLRNKHLTTKYDRDIIDFLDGMAPDNVTDEDELLKKWKEYDTNLRSRKIYIHCFLALGITLEAAFFTFNVFGSTDKKNDEASKVTIQLIVNSDTIPINSADTTIVLEIDSGCK